MIVPEPPVHEATEVEENAAATTITNEANDVSMAEHTVQSEDITATKDNVHPSTLDVVVPPPVPHTRAVNHGELITIRWPIFIPPTTPGPQYDYHVEQRPQTQKPKPRLPRLPSVVTTEGSFSMLSFREHNTFFNKAKNPFRKPKISSDGF